MPTTRGTRIALIAGAALAVATMTACGAQPDKAAAPAAPDAPATSAPASPSTSPSTTPAAEPPGAQPVVQEPAAKQPAKPRTYMDLRDANFLQGSSVKIPAGNGACPAATVRFDRNGRATIGNVEYWFYGEGSAGYGDVTNDGRKDYVLAITCTTKKGVSKQTLLVISATGPKTYATVARGLFTGRDSVERFELKNNTIITYDVHMPISAAKEVQEYKVFGSEVRRTAIKK